MHNDSRALRELIASTTMPPAARRKSSARTKSQAHASDQINSSQMNSHQIDSTQLRSEQGSEIPPFSKDVHAPPVENQSYSYQLKIPKDRIAVLIGKKGDVKQEIQARLDTTISVDSREGEVTISGKDALNLLTGREILKAIARGFNPVVAMQLAKTDYCLEIIDIGAVARSPKDLDRLRGRLIGAGGKCRRVIEELTSTRLSIYGKTVAIIGEMETIFIARRAVEMLLEGSSHPNVYKFLERQRRHIRQVSPI